MIDWRRVMTAAGVMAALVAVSRASDPATEPPPINTSPGPEYDDAHRHFQGIPSIERAPNGRLWILWYAGDTREGPQNYVLAVTSGDDGKKWSGPRLVIDPPGFIRAFDSCLWIDPQHRLWLFWAQAAGHWDGRAGVWAIVTSDPDSAHPNWSQPRRIADGVLLNKPIVDDSGRWLLPLAIWTKPANLAFINQRDKLNLSPEQVQSLIHDAGASRGPNVLASTDGGRTFRLIGRAPFPDSDLPTEHMLIERQDNGLWMLVRTRYGIGSSESTDGGRTWTRPHASGILQPSTRFFVRRLRSGHLLLVKNSPPNGKDRSHLTAFVSDDDGRTWSGGLLLDDRINVSYPDGVQAESGKIYIVYDRERFAAREILMATFQEEDVRKAKATTRDAAFQIVVDRAGSHD